MPGPDGRALEIQGGSLPYWSIDAETANYLEESADAIMEACKHLRSLDRTDRFQSVITAAIEVAHDDNQARWYASGYVHWEYLSHLDIAVLAMKRAKLESVKVAEENCVVVAGQWYILFRALDMAWMPALIVDDFTGKEVALLIQLLIATTAN